MITFFAAGMPQPKGSARAFMRPGMRHPVVVQANAAKGKTWQGVVSTAAVEAGVKPLEGPVSVSLVFLVPRPRSHYGTGKNASVLKASAPAHPSTKPDVDKLARACLDAMTGVAYRDDAQVFDLVALKAYCGYSGEERAGVFVTVGHPKVVVT